jgi:cytochrome c oxidase assembly protein subunit 15
LLTAAALATGTVVTGTGPHAGEEDVRRFGFDISNVAQIHSVTVIVAVAVAVALALWVGRRRELAPLQAPMSSWLFVGLLQGGLGYAQYFTGVPELLVGYHILGATVLWVQTVRLGIAVLDVAQPVPPQRRNAMDTQHLAV